MTHICVSKLTSINSDNGLLPGRRQAIIWTNAGILLIGPLGTNFSEILFEIHPFSFKKMHLKISSVKWLPFCLGHNVLTGKVTFHWKWWISLTHWSLEDLDLMQFSIVSLIGIFSSYDDALKWMPQDLTNNTSILVEVMSWCRQTASHYLSQCWLKSMSPYDVTLPQWVNSTIITPFIKCKN